VDPPATPHALVDSEVVEEHSTFSPDGKRLFFHNPVSNQLFVVDVRAEQRGLAFSAPAPLLIEGTIHQNQ